jgi:hypothetical protein
MCSVLTLKEQPECPVNEVSKLHTHTCFKIFHSPFQCCQLFIQHSKPRATRHVCYERKTEIMPLLINTNWVVQLSNFQKRPHGLLIKTSCFLQTNTTMRTARPPLSITDDGGIMKFTSYINCEPCWYLTVQ